MKFFILLILFILSLNSCTSSSLSHKNFNMIDSLAQMKKIDFQDVFYNNNNSPKDLKFSKDLINLSST
jgi:hypothetical protein